jgi:hypothetical protein
VLQVVNDCFTGDGGKIVEEVIDGLAAFEVLQKRLERNATSTKDGRSSKYIRISHDSVCAQPLTYSLNNSAKCTLGLGKKPTPAVASIPESRNPI